MASMAPPSGMCGAHSLPNSANEWQDTLTARAKPSRELSTTSPCRSCSGAQAMEWMTKSSLPNFCTACWTMASSSPSASTSQFTRSMPSGWVCGSTNLRALSFRQDATTSAPISRIRRAQPKAMLLSLAMPRIRPFLPARLNRLVEFMCFPKKTVGYQHAGPRRTGRRARWRAPLRAVRRGGGCAAVPHGGVSQALSLLCRRKMGAGSCPAPRPGSHCTATGRWR